MDWELICWYTRYALMSIYSCALMYVFYLFFMFSNLTFKARCFFDFFSYTGYTDISGLLQNKSAQALIKLCIERREKVLKLCCTVRYCLVIVAIKQMRVVPFPFELWEEMCCFCFFILPNLWESSAHSSAAWGWTGLLAGMQRSHWEIDQTQEKEKTRKSVCFQKVEARNRRSVFPSCPPVAFPQIPWLCLWFVFTFQENRSHHPQGVCRIGFPTRHTPAPPHLCLEY